MKPPITGPFDMSAYDTDLVVHGRTNIGPVNAPLAKIGNAYTRSSGFHISATEPPAQVSGVEPVVMM